MNYEKKIKQAEKKIQEIKNKLFIDGEGMIERGYIFNGRPMPKEEQDKLKKMYFSAYADLSIINMDMRDAKKKAAEENK